jgi:hypothetical protein
MVSRPRRLIASWRRICCIADRRPTMTIAIMSEWAEWRAIGSMRLSDQLGSAGQLPVSRPLRDERHWTWP